MDVLFADLIPQDLMSTLVAVLVGLVVALIQLATAWLNNRKLNLQNREIEAIKKQTNGLVDRLAASSKAEGIVEGREIEKANAEASVRHVEKAVEKAVAKAADVVAEKVVEKLPTQP